jgi:hypothetical protein
MAILRWPGESAGTRQRKARGRSEDPRRTRVLWRGALALLLSLAGILPSSAVLAAARPNPVELAAHHPATRCKPLTTGGTGAPLLHKCPARVLLGVTQPPSREAGHLGLSGAGTRALMDVAARAGHRVQIAADYQGWAFETGFNFAQARADAAAGAIEEISWEPWDYRDGTNQPAYSDAAIASGAYDTFLVHWADEAKQYGKPLFVRLAAEMNGNWDSWDAGVNGNSPSDYVAMWRHVVDVVRGQGADNISWVWAPNVSYPGSTPLAQLYPGKKYVDVVGLDGYNWGTSKATTHWESFGQIFGPDLRTLRALASGKPIFLAEVGSVEQGGSKAKWITKLVDHVLVASHVVGFAWFDIVQSPDDWSISSSSASRRAFRTALQGH